MKTLFRSRWAQFAGVLFGLTIASLLMWLVAALANNSYDYWYLLWNTLLAWVPFLLGFLVIAMSRMHGWRSWKTIVSGAAWLGFLPNTFYMVTDYIHLQEFVRTDVMLDIVMFTMFVITGLSLGFASVLMIHQEVRHKTRIHHRALLLGGIFLLCGFALYLGRELRWNTWDIISNPFGIIFNISDLIIHPGAHPQAFETTVLFFVFLSFIYYAIYRTSTIIRR